MAERAEWLAVMRNPDPSTTAAVHFDVDAGTCVQRVGARKHHPTLGPALGRAHHAGVVHRFQAGMQPPAEREGFGRVFTVRRAEDCVALLQALGARATAYDDALRAAPEPASDEPPAAEQGVVLAQARVVYCDMDGVLVDFERGVRKATGDPAAGTAQLSAKQMWAAVRRVGDFFEARPAQTTFASRCV